MFDTMFYQFDVFNVSNHENQVLSEPAEYGGTNITRGGETVTGTQQQPGSGFRKFRKVHDPQK